MRLCQVRTGPADRTAPPLQPYPKPFDLGPNQVRTGPSDRMATISTAIRALQQKTALKRAAGGAALLGGPRVSLLGEVVELAQPTHACVLVLLEQRAEYEKLRTAHEESRMVASHLSSSEQAPPG